MNTNQAEPSNQSSEPLKQKLIVGLAKVNLALKSQAWQEASLRGLTPTQSQILALLYSQNQNPMRLTTIANELAVTPATASDAVATLVEKGLVHKDKAPDDARAIALTLTEQGRQEADQFASWPELLLMAVDELSSHEKEVFLRSLLKIIRTLQEKELIPISKMCVTCRFFQPHIYSNSAYPHHCAFIDAPLRDGDLQLECPDHVAAKPETATRNWQIFCHGSVGKSVANPT